MKLKMSAVLENEIGSYELEKNKENNVASYKVETFEGETLAYVTLPNNKNSEFTPNDYQRAVEQISEQAKIDSTDIESVELKVDFGCQINNDTYFVKENNIARDVTFSDSNESYSVLVSQNKSQDKIERTHSDKYHETTIYQMIDGKQYPFLNATGFISEKTGNAVNTGLEISVRDQENGANEIGRFILRENGSCVINEKHFNLSKEDAREILNSELNNASDVEKIINKIDEVNKEELEKLSPVDELLHAIFGSDKYEDDVE